MSDLKQYDKEEEGRLVAAADEQEQHRAECAKRIHDLHSQGESKSWDQEQHLQYRQLKEKHDWHKEETSRIAAEVKAMRATKPMEPKVKKMVSERSLLDRWIRKGAKGLHEEELKTQQALLTKAGMNEISPGEKVYAPFDMKIFNAQPLHPGSDGVGANDVDRYGNSELVQEIVEQGVIDTLSDFGGAMECVTVMHTNNGNSISYPVYDDGATHGESGDNLADPIVDRTSTINAFNLRRIEAYPFNTGFVDISRYMSEDVDWDVGAFVRRTLLRRMGRVIERQLARGDGDDAPTGFLSRAGDTASGGSGVLSWEDLVTLVHSVDKAYLHGEMGTYGYSHKPGKVAFLTSWAIAGELQKIHDTQDRPLWMPSIAIGGYPTILGYPLHICQEFENAATGSTHGQNQIVNTGTVGDFSRPIAFGNFGYFVARFSGPGLMIEQHYDSYTAAQNHYRYMGRLRFDAECIGPLDPADGGADTSANRANDLAKCPAFKVLRINGAVPG